MKKVTKIVTLVATGLVALGAGPVSLAVATNVGAGAATEAAYSPVLVEADEDVTVNVPLVAKVGQTVKVQLAYNAKNYSVSAVTVNGELAAKVDDNNFYFVAPAGNINLKVEGHKIGVPSGTTTGYVVLNGSEAQGIYFQGIPETAQAGDEVVFSVGLAPDTPYSWTGNVYAFKLNNKGQKQGAVEVLKVGENKFSLIMPEGHVGLFADAEARAYFLTFNEELGTNLDKVEVKPEGSSKFTKVSAPYFIQAGSEVKATFKDSKGIVVKSCTGLGTTVEFGAEDATKAVTFTMPAKKVDLNVALDITYYQIKLKDNENTNLFNWAFRVSDKTSGTYTPMNEKGVTYGKYVRAYWTQKDGVLKKPSAVYFRYDEANSWNKSKTGSAGTDEYGAYYQFYLDQEFDFQLDVTGVTSPVTIDVSKTTDHLSARLVTKVGEQWVPAVAVYPSEYAYVQFTSNSSDYGVKDPVLNYSTSSKNALSVFDADANVYRSASTLNSAYSYTLDMQEATKIFDGAKFIGTFRGVNYYNANFQHANAFTLSDSYKFIINEFGMGSKGTSTAVYSALATTDLTAPQTELSAKVGSSNAGTILVSENWLMASYSSTGNYKTTNDILVCSKLAGVNGVNLYGRYYNTQFGAVQAIDANGNVLDSMFFTMMSSKPYEIYLSGVEFTTNNVGANTAYDVKVNGTVIGSVNGGTFTKA